MDSKCWGFVRNMQNSQVGFPGGASGKEPTCSAGDLRWGFDSWVRKISWRKNWQPTPVFLPGEPHGQRSLVGYSPWGLQRVRHNWSELARTHGVRWNISPSPLQSAHMTMSSISPGTWMYTICTGTHASPSWVPFHLRKVCLAPKSPQGWQVKPPGRGRSTAAWMFLLVYIPSGSRVGLIELFFLFLGPWSKLCPRCTAKQPA